MSRQPFPLEGVEMPAAELRLADVVRVTDGAWGTATVIKIEEDAVTFFRPYVQTADFSYTGGVIPYIGIETFRVGKGDTRPYRVLERKELK